MSKTIVLGVSGGIAAFKSAQLCSNLIKKGYDVEVIMTKNAVAFIDPLTFETLTRHNVMVSTFEKVADRSVKHISIAQRADLFIIVPATANVIAKIAHGLADDMLTTTFLAANCKKIIAPAMNTGMFDNPITQRNIAICKELGYEMIMPEVGFLACGDIGRGKLASIEHIETQIDAEFENTKLLNGKHVLITAGPTQEALDPVRYMTNHSTGKMGYELARAAKAMGAEVTLISGPVSLPIPNGVTCIKVTTALEMFEAMKQHYQAADIIVKAAAVGDYRAQAVAEHKIKKQGDHLTVEFVKNPDILAYVGEHKAKHQVLCGFAMETEHLLDHAKEKLISKHCDLIIANNLKVEGAGFANDTNVVTIVSEKTYETLEKMSKYELGKIILKHAHGIMKQREEA